MEKQLIARGQVTITTQTDVYTINQSINDYVFSAANNGTITTAATFTSTVKVTQNDINITDFTIGTVSKPTGFATITVNNTNKTIAYTVSANTTNLADQGTILIPIIIKNQTYYINLSWSKAKGGTAGQPGKDAYTISSTRNSFVISTDKQGGIHTAVTTTTVISALKGETAITPVIGNLPIVAGCTITKSGTTVTFVFGIGSALTENGIIDIPLTVDGKSFSVSFSYAKARTGVDGVTGAAGKDANLLDWVKDWNTNKTVIGSESVITPKIYAGVKNSNGTLTGVAIGKFPLSVVQASGSIATETVNGIYGFKDGYKTFFVDNAGNAQIGTGNHFIKYNAATGKVEFGSEVTLNWTNAANSALSSAKTYADTKKTEAINAAASDATNKINEIAIGGRNYLLNSSLLHDNAVQWTKNNSTLIIENGYLYLKSTGAIPTPHCYFWENTYKKLTVALEVGQTYTFSFDAKSNAKQIRAGFRKEPSSQIVYPYINNKGIDQWHRYSHTFTVDNNTWTNILWLIGINDTADTNKYLSIKNFKLESGNKATDWTLAPEDVDSSINQVKVDASNDATTKSNKAKTDAISAAATDATNKVNAVQVGVRNYILNSSFNVSTITGLLSVDGVTAVIDTATKYLGNNTIKVTQTAATGTAANTSRAYFTAKKQCNPASFSMWVIASAATNLRIRIGGDGASAVDIPITTSWKLIKIENKIPTSYVVLFGATTAGVTFNIACPMLVEGTKAADWTPAPEDVAADITTAKSAASSAQNQANTANSVAIAARDRLNNWASDSVISPNEKLVLKQEQKALADEKTQIVADAAKYSVSSTAYVTAFTNYNTQLTNHSAASPENISIAAAFASTQTAYYSAKQTVLNAIAAAAKKYAEDKATSAKSEAINAAATDATNKVNALQIGGRNLLNNSSEWRTAAWNNGVTTNGGGYTVDNTVLYDGKPTLKTLVGSGLSHPWMKLENGVEYTYSAIVMCNENITGNGSTPLHIQSGLNNVSQSKSTVTKFDTTVVANKWKRIYITFKLTGDADSVRPFFYRGANGTTTYWLAYLKLEKGNLATDWTPSVSDTTATIADAKKAGTDAKTVADAITKKATDEKWDTKLTYIDGTGIFTGKLSANTISAITINATQITAGTINAARIDVASLKTSLITAGNIEALTLNVVKGKIGGWTIDADSIFRGTKNNTANAFTAGAGSMTIGSNGIRGFKWNLESTGAGSVAGGNIKWDAAGNVTFGANVVLNWTNAANTAATSALNSAKTYADTKKTEAISAAASDATTKAEAAKEIAQAMAFGKMLFRDPTFFNGLNGVGVYNNSNNGTVTHTRSADNNAPNDSKQVIIIKNTGTSSPNCGGFYFAHATSYRKIFICRIIAKIPIGRNISYHSGAIGTGGTQKWLTPIAGTGEWCEYINKVSCGTASFGATNYFSITGATGTAAAPIEWRLAYATVFDVTSTEKYTTTIDGNGIYTSTLNANQITAGTISADRIAAGSIKADKLDAATVKASIINTDYINGLTLNFVRGKIGGWTIGADNIQAGSVNVVGQTPIQIRSVSSGSGYIYSGQFKPLGITLSWYQSSNAGHLVFGQVMATGNTVRTGFFGIQMMAWDNTEYFTISANITKSGAKEIYNRIAGWAFDNDTIFRGTKNNTAGAFTAGAGSISIGSNGIRGFKWRLDSTGAGAVAGGNISWDAAGNVTFGSSVSLQWKNDIEASKSENFGYRYYKKIIINGEENKYYPVIIKGGTQTVKRDILIRRDYPEQAPNSWNNATHKGGLILLIKTNFGGWGGMNYSWDIYELSETYSSMFSGAQHLGNMMHFAVFLRGGGTTGAVYHLYSDQPLDSQTYSPVPNPAAPQICYNQEVYWQSGTSTLAAPAPRTRTSGDIEEIRRRRFIVLSQERDSYLTSHPLTYIGSTGIYTGTLTANQVNAVSIDAGSIKAGTISVDRIAAGSITATKLNVANVQASVVTAAAVNGLTCTFNKGTIGGWSIGGDTIVAGSISAVGQTPIQIRPTSVGSGYWYTGAYKPLGITITWHQSGNAGHIVLGQVAATGNSPRAGFIGLQMMAWDNTEYFCLSANYSKSGAKEVYNRIAGWAFDNTRIWKNSVSLGADGSIQNGTKWQINNDGSGRLANGNIVWNAAGTVTFSAAVALNWQNYSNTQSNDAKELALAMAFGKMLYRDPAFKNGSNSINIYNNSGNGMVTHARISDSTAPNDTKVVIQIKNIGASSPGCGGFYFGTGTSYRKIFITRIIAKIPAGRNLIFATNSMGTGGTQKWLTPVAGTGDWCEYVCKVRCGTANFSSTNFFYLDGAVGSSAAPVEWRLAYATVFDVTSTENYTTTIDANGIYTGTVRANQVLVDSALVVGGSSYNGSISVRDASNSVKVTLDRTGITAVGGTIGGWTIAATQISKNGIVLGADGSITNGARWQLNTNGSGSLANGNISWDTSGNLSMRGKIEATSGTIGGFEISYGRIGSVASGSGSGGGLAIYNDLFRVGSSISYALLGDDTFPSSAGGAFKATARFTNTRYDSYWTNIGLYLDVRSARRNFGIHSNAALMAPFMITNKVKVMSFGSGSYSIDFAQNNIFFIYATTSCNVNLPTESSVSEMFGLSYLPSDFACVITFVYNYNWGNRVTFLNIRNHNGGLQNYAMERGDSITLLCAKYPSFHYQLINHVT